MHWRGSRACWPRLRQTGLTRGRQAGYVATSQRAPRPRFSRDYRKPGVELAVLQAYQLRRCVRSCPNGLRLPRGRLRSGLLDPADAAERAGARRRRGRRRLRRRLWLRPGRCGGCGLCPGGGYPEYPAFNQGPPVGQIAYPYYTTHGPRDFLRD